MSGSFHPIGLDQDLVPPLSNLAAMAEASRCLYCYEAACVTACPTSIDIPGFIRRIGNGNLTGAAKTILESNILGGTCARACPTEVLCEQACVRNKAEKVSVAIGRLQRHAVEHLIDRGAQPFHQGPSTGRRVAVVGAGPAGLACAHQLARLGHAVTLFDAQDKAGGLNEYGLAAYKMAGDFAAREVAFVLGVGGIEHRAGMALGRDVTLNELRQDHDAVFLGIGLGKTNRLAVEGEDLSGVSDAVDAIAALRQGTPPDVAGKRVIVIGGGNTAVDAAIQSLLLGAASVDLVYRRGTDQMGATQYEQDLARTSGVTLRTWLAPRCINGADGKVAGVEFERMEMRDGRLTGTGAMLTLPADIVLKAVGQKLDDSALAGLTLAGGKIAVDDDFATGLAGVWAGGDCVKSGEDLTVQSVADGKRAALSIDRALRA